MSGFIEARNVREAVSGGVKNNPIDPTGKLRAKAHDKDVYGNVPYQRVEYTAESITGFFNLDMGLLRSHNLGQDAFDLLTALALYKVRGFLEEGTRLRTACDLKPNGDLRITEPAGFAIPSSQELIGFLKDKIVRCKGMFASPPVTELETETVITKGKQSGKEAVAEEENE